MTFCGNTDCDFNNIVYFRGCSSPQVLNVLLCPGYRAVEEEKEAVAVKIGEAIHAATEKITAAPEEPVEDTQMKAWFERAYADVCSEFGLDRTEDSSAEKESVAVQDKSEPEKSDRENLKEYLFRTKDIKDDLIYSTEAGTRWGCDFCVNTGTEAEICKECEDGSHFERQEPEESESFIDPVTLHSRTCRCDACESRKILHNELKKTDEKDPNGIQQHAPGAKLDDGKLMAGLLQQWSRALTEVLKVSTFGAKKYSRGGWQHVKNGPERYTDAMFRHLLKEPVEDLDPDSELLHAAHTAWNALSRLELLLREKETQK